MAGFFFEEEATRKLSDVWLCPPFSVLNAREGRWQSRKREWLDLGISSELGRAESLLKFSFAAQLKSRVGKYQQKPRHIPESAAEGSTTEIVEDKRSGTSIFDPVLCELMYRWYCPKGGVVLDPFAGGSVRGIVAAGTGRGYIGIDLRKEQIEANQDQWLFVLPNITGGDIADETLVPTPEWVTGDASVVIPELPDNSVDFVFSCPPYGPLEKYSDLPDDLSNMSEVEFRVAYKKIIIESCKKLKDNSFAAYVVGEYRGKNGHYVGFVPFTHDCFKEAGLEFHGEIILITAIGTLPFRVRRQFESARRPGKTHQNILLFVKGDAKIAAQKIGPVEIADEQAW